MIKFVNKVQTFIIDFYASNNKLKLFIISNDILIDFKIINAYKA